MKVLGIETSADDTGIALIEADGTFGDNFSMEILADGISSQSIHTQYGGIFPAMAKKEHAKNLPILFENVLGSVEKAPADMIAVTVGPGLEPCLWTGITFAQELVKKWNVPVVATNHMEGHILISLLRNEGAESYQLSAVSWPALVLLISGGHTELVLMKEFQSYVYVGRTRDDAVGEAFDKVARMLGLPYPGGPHISRLAEEARDSKLEAPFKLPRPMIDSGDFDFSFAGLKTAVLRLVEAHPPAGGPLSDDFKKQIAREFENAAAEVLVGKTLRAVEEYGAQTIIVGGGVSANTHIKHRLAEALGADGTKLFISAPEFATDNAIMIALAGYFHALKKEFTDSETLRAEPDLTLSN